jgi:acetyl esterase/lipase
LLRAAAAGGAALAAGCSPLHLINGLAPSRTYRATKALAYGPHPRDRLDVYRPAEQAAPAPLVVFFYGGNWKSGERADYLFVGEALAARGFVAVIPDYRLYPEVRFPAFLEDCAAATSWAFDRAAEIGADPSRLFLMGHSAGAYNAAMLGLNPAYLKSVPVRGWIGLAGPYDFLPLESDVSKAVFGFPDTPLDTQPIRFVSSQSPPALLATGERDATVRAGNTRRLAAKLGENGVRVREILYPGVSHLMLIGSLAAAYRGYAPVLDDIAGFVSSFR